MRSIVRIASSRFVHPFIFTAQWLRMVSNKEYRPGPNGGPVFEDILNPDSYLVRLAKVVKRDGSLNGKSIHAERFAICLGEQGNNVMALELFLAIADGEKNVLLIHDPPQNGAYYSSEVADTPGKLGYEGVYRFATLAIKCNEEKLARQLFLEIVEKIPTKCYPVRLQDIRMSALESLKRLGIKTLSSGVSLADELRTTEINLY